MSEQMKALVKEGPHPGLVLVERPSPKVESDEIRIRGEGTCV